MRALLPLLLLVILSSTLPSRGESVRERLQSDQSLQLYTVIFGITQNPDGTIKECPVREISDARKPNSKPVQIDLPAGFLAAAQKAIRDRKYELKLKDGLPVEFFTYFFYVPKWGDRLISDMNADVDAK